MTRDDIFEAAAQIFREKGFHAASMQEIAAAVNLQKASLYHHVSSKQELLAGLLDQALDLLIERMQQVAALDLLPADKFARLMRAYLETLAEYPDLAAVLLLEHRSLEAEYRRRHIPRRDRFEAIWRETIEAGMASGDFATGDAGLATKTALGVANWTVTWFRRGGRLSAGDIADFGAQLLLQGLQARD